MNFDSVKNIVSSVSQSGVGSSGPRGRLVVMVVVGVVEAPTREEVKRSEIVSIKKDNFLLQL